MLNNAIVAAARLLAGIRVEWRGAAPDSRPRVYFANHRSHADFILLWAVLPPPLHRLARPVAGADYWLNGRVRRFGAQRVFGAVLIDRRADHRVVDPIAAMAAALADGNSLILFPEGTRNTTDAALLPFRNGLYRLAAARPEVEFVPVWIENLHRVMPKGEVVPIPLLCSVRFGSPFAIAPGEDRDTFLDRSRSALLALDPRSGRAA